MIEHSYDYYFVEELLGKLEYYIRTRLPRKVVLQRLAERNGLIRARLHGAKVATGEVLVFLDSHCEVGPQWYEFYSLFKLVSFSCLVSEKLFY